MMWNLTVNYHLIEFLKMRLILVLSIVLFTTSGICQEKTIQSLYINIGLGTAMNSGSNLHIGGNFSNVKLYTISFNYYKIYFPDKVIIQYKSLFGPPWHKIDDYEFSCSKFFQLHKRFRAGMGVGISYLRYYEPVNITLTSKGIFRHYIYDEEKHNGFGIKVKGGIEFQVLNFAGLGLDLFYQYNPYYPYFGANINLLLGKLRPRINRDSD